MSGLCKQQIYIPDMVIKQELEIKDQKIREIRRSGSEIDQHWME